MRAGRLRDRVSFQAKQSTPDGAGGSTVGWVEQFTRWGQVIEDKGRERVEGGRLASPFSAVLSIRSSTQARQITTAWRCVIKGEAWNIRSIGNPDRRNQRLELVIERGVAT
jgi:SPP1 family predicted phage head-tail adaptor